MSVSNSCLILWFCLCNVLIHRLNTTYCWDEASGIFISASPMFCIYIICLDCFGNVFSCLNKYFCICICICICTVTPNKRSRSVWYSLGSRAQTQSLGLSPVLSTTCVLCFSCFRHPTWKSKKYACSKKGAHLPRIQSHEDLKILLDFWRYDKVEQHMAMAIDSVGNTFFCQ